MSVAIAVFLFASLRAVLDGFNAGAEAQLVDADRDDPLDVADVPDADQPRRGDQEHAGRAGRHLGELVRRHLQGSEELLRAVRRRARKLPAHVPGDHADARGAQGVPRRSHRLHRRRRAGEDVTASRSATRSRCRSAFRSTARSDYDFTIRGIYRSGGAAVDNQSMMFHWKYADERSIAEGADRLVRRADRQSRSGARRSRARSTRSSRIRRTRPRPTPSSSSQTLVRVDVRQPEPAARQHRAGRGHHDAVRGRQHDGDVGARADDRDRGDADARASRRRRSSCWSPAKGC